MVKCVTCGTAAPPEMKLAEGVRMQCPDCSTQPPEGMRKVADFLDSCECAEELASDLRETGQSLGGASGRTVVLAAEFIEACAEMAADGVISDSLRAWAKMWETLSEAP